MLKINLKNIILKYFKIKKYFNRKRPKRGIIGPRPTPT
jgi:hypothetical protein